MGIRNFRDRSTIMSELRAAKRMANGGIAVLIAGGALGTLMAGVGFYSAPTCELGRIFAPNNSCAYATNLSIAGGVLLGLSLVVGVPLASIGADSVTDLRRELSQQRRSSRVWIQTSANGATFHVGWEF